MAKKKSKRGAKQTQKKSKKKTSRPRKKAAKKLARESREALYLTKLDPLLRLGAARAGREKPLPAPTLGGGLRKLGSLRDLEAGVHSLAAQSSPRGVRRLIDEDVVSVIVDCRRVESVGEKIDDWNASCSRVASSTLVAQVPRRKLSSLARLRDVNYVEASTALKLHCDQAHLSSGLLRGGARTVPQTGAGVLVGIIDTGIDVTHPAFRSPNGATRIVRYVDQFTGRQFDAPQIESGEADDIADTSGHGTHVAGIAAGNGAGSPGGLLAGVAPESDLVIVKSTLETADILMGIADIFQLAGTRNQPAVVNCSFGGHVGGHDGTTLVERTIDQLSGPGKIVVISAGNEGNDPIHAHTVLRGDGAEPARWEAGLRLNAQRIETAEGPMELGILVLQIWHQREDGLAVRLRAPSSQILEPPPEGTNELDFGSFLVNATRQQHRYSGDTSVTFQILALPEPEWLGGWRLLVEEEAPGSARVGSVHAWIRNVAEGVFTTGVSPDYVVGMPATAYSAITVASYATRNEWSSRDPSHPTVRLDALELEAISAFSSRGPTRDGQNKPEVAAPGEWLLAPLSSAASLSELPLFTRAEGIEYASLRGTSMSAPYVTGALALLLEKDRTIDWAEAKRRILKSARQDGHTEVAWNRAWGYGKLDVERLLTIEPGP